ncbi:nuclear speckle splicing regulatory protein 1-like [Acipenser ruthenus]|uniref:nuclear speckle splicing regulatory protein 1-like n=1 Tax=Acipenser ruthenus TaxID=7906 RepID=UPI00145BD1D6|nr:nuclear speckle splicing regulatory protein 1-like [Acipenser ruthenus]
MAAPTKQYGLILPKKAQLKTAVLQRPSVFGDDSDDETSVGESLQKEAVKKKMMKQTRLEMQKALEQDASVYEYDSVYEELQKKKEESSAKGLAGADKKPKYIANLLRAVELRKKEQDRRNERKIQLEREAEGEQFQDKEAFVTSAYRSKLLETQEEEESERREAAIEAALDVKKQEDLSGFYRHLLNQTVGEEKLPDREKRRDPPVNESQSLRGHNPQDSQDKDDDCEIDSEGEEEQREKTKGGSSEASKAGAGAGGGSSGHPKRQYRQRSPSSESEVEMEKKERESEGQMEKKHRKDRDRERGDRHSRSRKEERKRDRGDRDREDRHRGKEERDRREKDRRKEKDSRRTASPKEKGKVEEGERVKEKEERGSPAEEKRSRGGSSSSSAVPGGGGKEVPETGGEQAEPSVNKFAKRSSEETVMSARDRYLARQMSRSAAKTYIEKEED